MSTYLHRFQNEEDFYNYLLNEYQGGGVEPFVSASFVPNHKVDFKPRITEEQELTFEAINDGAYYWKKNCQEALDKTIEYKKNDGAWTPITSTSAAPGTLITTVKAGDIVKFRGDNAAYCDLVPVSDGSGGTTNTYATSGFRLSAGHMCFAYGNVNSLINSTGFTSVDTFTAPYTFLGLFGSSTGITTTNTKDLFLPTTGLTNNCYVGMFMGTGIRHFPYLPAKTVPDNAYRQMFQNCQKLNDKIELPATTIGSGSYRNMFTNCTSLKIAPVFKTEEIIGTNACTSMFAGCTSLENTPETLPAMSLSGACYQAMFSGCTSLTGISKDLLPATTVPINGYRIMFVGCSALENVPDSLLPATELDTSCYYGMFVSCTSLKTAPSLPALTVPVSGYAFMYSECTSLNEVPVDYLPAENIADAAYFAMFEFSSLMQCPNLPATGLGQFCYHLMFSTINTPLKPPAVMCATTMSYGACYNMFRDTTYLLDTFPLPATTLAPYCYRSMFEHCKIITKAPKLPATTLAESCYRYMFMGCDLLQEAPDLPATALTDHCYNQMFLDCKYLKHPPVICGITADVSSCSSMFGGCTSLEEMADFHFTAATTSSFNSMYSSCKSLTKVKEMPLETIGASTCESMFLACSNLVSGPKTLEPETLASRCYYRMFDGCSSLVDAPELPAKTLQSESYRFMFRGCTNLNYIKCLATDISAENCTGDWVQNVASAGTFIKDTNTSWTTGNSGIPTGWDINESMLSQPLTFEVISGGTLYWTASPNGTPKTIEYKVNDGEWSSVTSTNETSESEPGGTEIGTFSAGDVIQFRGDNDGYAQTSIPNNHTYNSYDINRFRGDENVKYYVYGNIMSLVDSTGFATLSSFSRDCAVGFLFYKNTGLYSHQTKRLELPAKIARACLYHDLFNGCTSMTKAPELQATSATGRYAYGGMFYNCSSLEVAPPILKQDSIEEYQCWDMFNGCTSLITPPEVPATYFKTNCFQSAFYNCRSMTSIPTIKILRLAGGNNFRTAFYGCTSITDCSNMTISSAITSVSEIFYQTFKECTNLEKCMDELPTLTLNGQTYNGMFHNCNKLKKAPKLPATTLAGYCYENMFYNCYSLKIAPELPATTLVNRCYYSMFEGCSGLTTAPALPATALGTNCYYRMFANCKNLVSAPILPAETLATACYAGMFSDCTSLASVPDLPATTLANDCYNGMFASCTKIVTVPEKLLQSTELKTNCYRNMFFNCTALTSLPELPATTLADNCYLSMFQACKSITGVPTDYLPATTLTTGCYQGMFRDCTYLVQPPKLPAMTLAPNCYYWMFYQNSNLVEGPVLPALTLASQCYYEIFRGCNKMNKITCLATDISASGCVTRFSQATASSGTFVKHPDMNDWTTGVSGIPGNWTVEDAVLS